MIYIGIDPGVSGGIAAVDELGILLFATATPSSELDVFALLPAEADAAIERVSASPQMGTVSAFTFGRSYGALLMALAAKGCRTTEVTPRRWQAAMGVIYPKASTRTERKNLSKRRAQQLFPRAVVTHALADAMLLSEYCRRTTRGERHGEEGQRKNPRSYYGAAVEEQAGQIAARIERATRTTLSGASRHGAGTKHPA